MAIDLTKLSKKEQVVIPNAVRKKLALKEGMKLLVFAVGNAMVLRRLMVTEEKIRLRQLLEESRSKAEKIGFTAKEIEELIHQTRKVS